METSFPLMFAAIVGFSHAFEADHLVAVSNIVTKRKNLRSALKDGMYWGLGHTSTIFLIGLLLIVGNITFLNDYFLYFEVAEGVMLIVLVANFGHGFFGALYRVWMLCDMGEFACLRAQMAIPY